MRRTNKIIGLLFLLSLVLIIYPKQAASAEVEWYRTQEDKNGWLGFDKDTQTLTWYQDVAEEITVPEEIDGVKVKKIGEWAFYQHDKLIKVTLPETIEEIENGAFYECQNMETIIGFSNVKNIGNYVFYKCKKLENIDSLENVKTVGERAFYACQKLRGLKIPSADWELADDELINEVKAEGTMKVYELIQKYLDPDYVKLRYHETIAHSNGYDSIGYEDVSKSDYKKLKKLAKKITKGCKTDYEKIMALGTAIAERVYYDNYYLHGPGKDDPKWQPMEIWNSKRTTCIGYSMLFLIMADTLDIPCMRMYWGTHVFNIAYSYSEKRWIIMDTMQAAIPKEYSVDGEWIGSDKIIEAWLDVDPERICEFNQSLDYVEGLLVGNMYYRLNTGWELFGDGDDWGLKPMSEWTLTPLGKKEPGKKAKSKKSIAGIKVEK